MEEDDDEEVKAMEDVFEAPKQSQPSKKSATKKEVKSKAEKKPIESAKKSASKS